MIEVHVAYITDIHVHVYTCSNVEQCMVKRYIPVTHMDHRRFHKSMPKFGLLNIKL